MQEIDLVTSRLASGRGAQKATQCPDCKRTMTPVVRVTHCPCDAPWCVAKTEHLACVECGPNRIA